MAEPQAPALLAEFDDPEAVLAAVRELVDAGYERIEVYGPTPLDGVDELLPDPRPARIARWSFVGGLLGGAAVFGFQVWAMAVDWPIDVGGRAPLSWPAFLVPTFEGVILSAAIAAVLGLFHYAELPRPHHRVFDLDAFERASDGRFFLALGADDPRFEPARARALLQGHDPREVHALGD